MYKPVNSNLTTYDQNFTTRKRLKKYIIILCIIILIILAITFFSLRNKDKENAEIIINVNTNNNTINNTIIISNDTISNDTIPNDTKINEEKDENIDLNADFMDFNPNKIHIKVEKYPNPSTIRNYPLDEKTDTKCLDGSQYGIYFAPGRDSGKNKIIIGFEGMSWCYDRDEKKIPEKCKKRTSEYYGSSKTWKDEYIYDYNIYGGEESKNEQFFNWNEKLQKDEISNLPVHLSERLSHKKNGYGIVYELAMEMFSQEDLDDLVAVIQIKLE